MSDIRNMTTEELAKTIAFHTSYSGSYVVNSHLRELARRLEAAEAANKALNTATEIERLRELVAFNEDQRRMLFDAATTLEAERDRWKAEALAARDLLSDYKIDAQSWHGDYPNARAANEEVPHGQD